jgi:integrase
MGLYLRNNRYYFKRQLDGRAYYVALKLKRGQEALLSGRIKQVEESIIAQHFGLPAPSPGTINLADYITKYLGQKTYKKTLDRDKQRLLIALKILGDLPLSVISKQHVKKLEEELFRQKRGSATVNRYFELLSHMLNLAIEDGYLKENPCKYYQRFVEDHTRRALTRPELSRILKVTSVMQKKPKNHIQSMMYDFILIGLSTGMRLSEILFMKHEYIQGHVIIYPITETKYRRRVDRSVGNTKVRIIYINNILKVIIDKYSHHKNLPLVLPPLSPPRHSPPCNALHAYPYGPLHPVTKHNKNASSVTSGHFPLHSVTLKDDGYVFPMPWRNPNAIFRTVLVIRDKAKVPDFSFHMLRHTVSSWIAEQSSLITAQAMLGHANIQTTMRYSHPEIEAQKKSVAKIESMIKGLLPK